MPGAPRGGSLFPRELGARSSWQSLAESPRLRREQPWAGRAHPLPPPQPFGASGRLSWRTVGPAAQPRLPWGSAVIRAVSYPPRGLSSTSAPWWLGSSCPPPVTSSGPALALSPILTLRVSSSAETVNSDRKRVLLPQRDSGSPCSSVSRRPGAQLPTARSVGHRLPATSWPLSSI